MKLLFVSVWQQEVCMLTTLTNVFLKLFQKQNLVAQPTFLKTDECKWAGSTSGTNKLRWGKACDSGWLWMRFTKCTAPQSIFFLSFVLRRKGSKTKESMKQGEKERSNCGPPTRKVFFFLRFCRTWTKRYLITSQTRVKRVRQIHNRTILYRLDYLYKTWHTCWSCSWLLKNASDFSIFPWRLSYGLSKWKKRVKSSLNFERL